MFCPSCECEFRAGFERCEGCGVDLVEELGAANVAAMAEKGAPAIRDADVPLAVPMTEYCAFLDLEEARKARDQLREQGIRSEIVIRETPESLRGAPLEEESWLRVEAARLKSVQATLGYATADESEDSTLACGVCGARVSAAENLCPKCGARFDED
jgi:hypothetical protein